MDLNHRRPRASIWRSTNWATFPYGTRCTNRTHYQLVWSQSSVLLRLRFIWYGAASECFPRFCCLEGSCARWSTNAAYWSGWWGTIPQPLRWQRNALPIELHPHMVELVGFEPTTPSVQAKCSPNWATAPYGTRYWIRTNNLFFVREAFSHWNNRVNNVYVWKKILSHTKLIFIYIWYQYIELNYNLTSMKRLSYH